MTNLGWFSTSENHVFSKIPILPSYCNNLHLFIQTVENQHHVETQNRNLGINNGFTNDYIEVFQSNQNRNAFENV